MKAHPRRAVRLLIVIAGTLALMAANLVLLSTIARGASLTVSKSASAAAVSAGQLVTYTLQLAYDSSGSLIVDVTDTVPSGSDFWTCINCNGFPVNGNVVWHVIGLTSGSPVSVQFTARPTRTGTLHNANYQATSAGFFAIGPPVDVIVTAAAPANLLLTALTPQLAGTTANVTATVRDAFNNLATDGTIVTFSADHGTFGASSTVTATTSGGVAIVAYTANTLPGSALLSASAGAANGSAPVSTGSGPAASVIVTAAPASVPANGLTTSALTVTVRDQYGNVVADNTSVTLTTSIGVLGTGFPSIAGVTAGGRYNTLLKSSQTGAAIVIAQAGTITGSTGVTFTAGAPTSLQVAANPQQIVANGTSTTNVSVTALDALNNVVDNQTLTMTLFTSGGVFTSSNASSQTLVTSNGIANATLRSDTLARAVIVTGTSPSLPSAVASVVFAPGPVNHANLSANPLQLQADGESQSQLTLDLFDQFNNSLSGTLPLTFTASAGSIVPSNATAINGHVSTLLTAGTQLTTALINVAVPGLPAAVTTTVKYVIGPPAFADYTFAPATPLTVSTSAQPITGVLTITLTNRLSQPLTAGEVVSISDTLGNFVITGTTNAQGVIVVAFQPIHAGSDQIIAAGSIIATGPALTFVAGPLASLVIAPSSATLPATFPQLFTVSGRDEHNNIISGLIPQWTTVPTTTNKGVIDASGIFTGHTAGSVNIKATVGVFTQIAPVTVVPGPLDNVALSIAPTTILADGVQASTLVFNMYDFYNNQPFDGAPLIATTSLGSVFGSGTSVNGHVTRFLTSTVAGVATIGVQGLDSLHVNGTDTVTVQSGIPNRAVVSASTLFTTPVKAIPANGVSTATLTIVVQDSHGNPVHSGLQVKLTTSAGTLNGLQYATDGNGSFQAVLTSLTTTATANFNVSYNNNNLAMSGDGVAFVVGHLDHIKLLPGGAFSVTSGVPLTFTARGQDAYDAYLTNLFFDWTAYNIGGTGLIDARGVFTPAIVGDVIVQAHANDGFGDAFDSATLTVLPGAATSATLIATPAAITATGQTSATLDLSLSDGYGNAVTGHAITLTTSLGSVPTTTVTDGSGNVTVPYTSSTLAGHSILRLRDLLGGKVVTANGYIDQIPGPAYSGTVFLPGPDLVADGASTAVITLTLRDQFGNPVSAGWLLPVATNSPLVAISGNTASDASGMLTRTLQSITTTLAWPYQWVDNSVNGYLASAQAARVIPGPLASLWITADHTTLSAGGDTTPIHFELSDAYGHHISDGTPLTLGVTPTLGTLDAPTVSLGGFLTRTLTTGSVAGTTRITTSNGLTVGGDITYTVVPSQAARISVTVNPTVAVVGSVVVISGTVTDFYGNRLIAPTPVTVTALLGLFLPNASSKFFALAQSGVFTAQLTSTVAYTDALGFVDPAGVLTQDPGSQTPVYMPGPLATVAVGPGAALTVTAGATKTLFAQGFDSFGNLKSGLAFTWTQSALAGQPGYVVLPSTGATVGMVPQRVGADMLKAMSGAVTSAPYMVTVLPGAPAAAYTYLTPSSLTANGVSTATFNLNSISDVFGNTIADDLPLTATIQSPLQVAATARTAAGGATFVVTSALQSGVYPIHVAGTQGNLVLTGTSIITLTPGPLAQASVTASPASMFADGVSTARLALTLRDVNGNLVADGTNGVITGSLGLVNGGVASQHGVLTRTYRAGSVAGAESLYITGIAITPTGVITLVPGAIAHATVHAQPTVLIADGVGTSILTITATDTYGNLVANGATVAMTATLGALTGTMTTVAGVVTRTLTASTTPGIALFVVNGIAATGDVVTFVPGPATHGTVTAQPATLVADGVATTTLRLTLRDQFGNPIANGSSTAVTATLGTLKPYAGITTTTGGVLTYTLSSTVTGHATVLVNAFTLSPTNVITFVPGLLHHIAVSPAGPLTPTAGISLTFSAEARDRYENPISGIPFTWRTALGPGQGLIDADGVFTGTHAGYLAVTASGGGVTSAFDELYVLPGAVYTASVTRDIMYLPSFTGTQTMLTVTLRDAYGNLAAEGTPASVSVNRGFIAGSGLTSYGMLTRTLAADASIGGVVVRVNGTITASPAPALWLVPGPAVSATVEAHPPTILADGVSTSTLFITLRDAYGRRVSDAYLPQVTTTLGTLTGTDATVDGVMTRTLTAGFAKGTATIGVAGIDTSGDRVTLTGAGEPALAQLSAYPLSILADAISTATFTLTVADAGGHAVPDGTPITLTTALGMFDVAGAGAAGTAGAAGVLANAPMTEGVRKNVPATVWATARFTTTNGLITGTLHSGVISGTALFSSQGISITGTMVQFHTVVANGGFEGGTSAPWVLGTSAGLTSTLAVSDAFATPRSGTHFLLLGSPSISNTGHPTGTAFAYETIRVPAASALQSALRQDTEAQQAAQPIVLSLWYHMFTYDVLYGCRFDLWDSVDVSIRTTGGVELAHLLRDGNVTDNCQTYQPSLHDLGWRHLLYDLTPYAGQDVQIYISLSNRNQPVDDSWVYVDDVNIGPGTLNRVFLPSVTR